MKIFFLSSFDFNIASAGQARQRLIIGKLQQCGFEVLLLNAKPNSAVDLPFSVRSLPNLRWNSLQKLLVAPWIFLEVLRRVAPGDVVISFDRSPLTTLPVVLAVRLRSGAIVQELTEHPKDGASPTRKGQFLAVVFETMLPRFDGFIVISTALRQFVLDRVRQPKTVLVPAIGSEPSISEIAQSGGSRDVILTPMRPFTFLYAGSLSEPKDGVLSLIAAFAAAFKNTATARLDLLGYGSDAQKAAVRATITDSGLSSSVTLHDPVPQDALPVRLAAADALVLCRPLSRQATYGFPTKLAEYLAAGRPVIVTQTSDIGHYLRDGVSAFLVPPNDTAAFAATLYRAATDPVTAAQIGAAGHAVFLAEFEAGRAVSRLSDWLRSEFSRAGGPG